MKSSARPPAAVQVWLQALGCLLVGAVVAFALVLLAFPVRIPPELQGAWVVVEGEEPGTVMEFFRDGTLLVTMKIEGKKTTIHASARVVDNTIRFRTPSSIPGRLDTDTQEIVELTDRKLVLQDARSELMILARQADAATRPASESHFHGQEAH